MTELCSIQTAEHYFTLRRNTLSRCEEAGRSLACVLLNDRSQFEELHTVRFQLPDIHEKVSHGRQLKDQWLPGTGLEGQMTQQGTENAWGSDSTV